MSGSLVTAFLQWSKNEGFLTDEEAQRIESNVKEPPLRAMSVSLSMRSKSIAQNKEWQSILNMIVKNQSGINDQAAVEESLLHSFGSYLMDSVALENGYRGRIKLLARELRHAISSGLSDLRCSFELPEALVSIPHPGTIQLKLLSPSSLFPSQSDSQADEFIFKTGCVIHEGAAMHLIREFSASETMPITISHPGDLLYSSNYLASMDIDSMGMVLEGMRRPLKHESHTLFKFEYQAERNAPTPPTPIPNSSPLLSLPPSLFDNLFPFHIAVDRSCRIVQVGRLMQQLIPALVPTSSADRYLNLRCPCSEWSFESILEQSRVGSMFSLLASGVYPLGKPSEPYPATLELKGQFIPLPSSPSFLSSSISLSQRDSDQPMVLVFIGSPRFLGLEDLESLGLTLSDLPTHDASRDLVITQYRTDQLALALSDVRESEKMLSDTIERANAREAKLFAAHDDSHSTAELLNGAFHFSHRANHDSDSQTLFVTSPVTRGHSMHYSGVNSGSVEADAGGHRLLSLRSGMSESGRASRLNIGSRPPELSGPLFPPSLSHLVMSTSTNPQSLHVDMDTPANKLLKMMDGIMSGQGVLLEDALAIQEAAGGKSKWHEPINLKEQLKMSGLADDVNQSLRQLLEGHDDDEEDEEDEEQLLSTVQDEECDGRTKVARESMGQDPMASSAYVRKDTTNPQSTADGVKTHALVPSSSQPQTLDLFTSRSSLLPSPSLGPPPAPRPTAMLTVPRDSSAVYPMPSFSNIPSLVSLESWTKSNHDPSFTSLREERPLESKPSDHVRFAVPASPSVSSEASTPKRRQPPRKQGSWGEAAMLTARAASASSNTREAPPSLSNLHRVTPAPPPASRSLNLSISQRSSIEIPPHGSSLQTNSTLTTPHPSAAMALTNQRRSSVVESLEDGKLSVRGPGTRARRMSIPCAPFEETVGDLDPASSRDEEEMLKGGVGSGRRSSLTSSDIPVGGKHQDHAAANRDSAGNPVHLLDSQSVNSISILDAAVLAKQARCKILSVMVTVDESFSLVYAMAAGASSIGSYSRPSAALTFNLATATKGQHKDKGLSVALKLLQGHEGYNISDDSYTGSFDANVSPPREPSDRLNLLLAQVDAWQFDTFALDEVTDGHALSSLGFALIKRTDAFRKFKMDEPKLARFLIDIESGYSDNFVGVRYHSAIHAADVLRLRNSIQLFLAYF